MGFDPEHLKKHLKYLSDEWLIEYSKENFNGMEAKAELILIEEIRYRDIKSIDLEQFLHNLRTAKKDFIYQNATNYIKNRFQAASFKDIKSCLNTLFFTEMESQELLYKVYTELNSKKSNYNFTSNIFFRAILIGLMILVFSFGVTNGRKPILILPGGLILIVFFFTSILPNNEQKLLEYLTNESQSGYFDSYLEIKDKLNNTSHELDDLVDDKEYP